MQFALGLGAVTLVSDIFRILFFTLDMIIYGLIPLIYQMIYSLYDIEVIFSGTQIDTMFNNFASSIYSFLAIFMFFRIAFSLITMIVDPSVIDDKDKGAKKIVTNIMICLVLIVVVPIVFDYSKLIQTKIFEERLIEKVVIGENYDFEENNLGEKLSRTVLGIFLSPNEGNNDSLSVSRYNEVFENDGPLSILLAHINSISPAGLINSIFDDQKGITFYSYSYTWPLSTIVGLYILWMFIQMMVDVAYRSIKFIALEILSPVAIVSYIDPGSSKKGVFSKWLNETVKTYIGLFIRIFVYSFASALLSFINVVDMNGNIIQNLFFILAIIAFIKNAPKFIDNLFGTSISKESESNLASGLKSVLGFAGMATGAVAGGISNAVVAKRAGKTMKGAAWAGVKGAFAGGSKGMSAGKKGGFGGMTGVVTNAFGSYGEAKKKYGINDDPEMEKLANSLESKIKPVDDAKGAAVASLESNNNEGIKKILSKGIKVNGHQYGRGLDDDEGIQSALKRNAAGLAKDEILHAGNEEVLILKRQIKDRKDADAIMQRTLALATAQEDSAKAAYNSYTTTKDKVQYIRSFEMNTGMMEYANLSDAELSGALETEFNKLISNKNMTDERKQQLRVDFDARMQKINSSDISHKDKLDILIEQRANRVVYETANLGISEIDSRFETANNERIVAMFGNSMQKIKDDAGKVSGEVKDAQGTLDIYLKGRGKHAKDIDSAYSLADSRHKAKKLEEKRREELERQRNNNS